MKNFLQFLYESCAGLLLATIVILSGLSFFYSWTFLHSLGVILIAVGSVMAIAETLGSYIETYYKDDNE
jgi:hypothetical protein